MKTSILFICLILFSCKQSYQEETAKEFILEKRIDSLNNELEILKSTISKIKQNNSSRLKTNEPIWIDKNGNEYTADEIRQMRKNDPDHIYRTTGQPVYSDEEIIDKRIEEYER